MSKQPINSFAGKWALITGASSGLGLAFADLLAAHKVNLVLAARRQESMEKLASDLRREYGGGCAGRADRPCLAGRGQPLEMQSRREVGDRRHLVEQCRIRPARRLIRNADRAHRSDSGVRLYATRAAARRARRFRLLARRGRERDWVRLPMSAIKGILPPSAPPDPEAPGPFSFGDRGRVSRIRTAAGFTDIAIAPFDASVPFGEGGTRDAAIDPAVKMTLEVGPLSRALADQPDDIRARASAAVRAAFAGLPGERSVMIDGAAWIVMACNPAS